MREEQPTVQAPGGPLPGYLATPEAWPPGPALVVVHEWWGLNEDIRDICRRFAEQGVAAFGPDLYRSPPTADPEVARRWVERLYGPSALEDLRAAVGWLLERGATAVGAVGFCVGGTLVWRLAHAEPRLRAAAPFYPGRAAPEGELRCPLQLHLADPALDLPRDRVEALSRHLALQPHPSEVHVYPGAGHSFFNAGPRHDAEAAALARERLLAFVRAHLGPPAPGP